MLASGRVEVEGGSVSYIATSVVGNDGDVIADLILVRPAFLGVKRIAHRHVRRPRNARVSAVGVEKLRIEIVRVAVVIPDRVEPAIGRYRERAEPVPLARVVVVVNSDGRAEGCAAVGAASEHHVGRASSGRLNARQHVNVVVRRGTRMVHCKKCLPIQASWIDPAASQIAAHVNRGDLIKNRGLVSKLRIARTRAPKIESFATDVEVAVAINIERAENGLVRDINWRLPCDSCIGRTVEQSARTVRLIERLVLKVMPRAARLINRKPLFIASDRALLA